MTHEDAHSRELRQMLEQHPEIAAIVGEGTEAGWTVDRIFEVVQERLGLEARCTLSLATSQQTCKATHPEHGGKCWERHPHTGPHAYRVTWFDPKPEGG